MDPVRALTRLNAGAGSMEPRSDGVADISRADIMAAVGSIPSRLGQSLVLAAWCDDIKAVNEVYMHAHTRFARACHEGEWQRVPSDRLHRLAVLAAREVVGSSACRECGGRGQVGRVRAEKGAQSLLVEECPQCLGAGLRSMSGRERARIAGMDHKSWRVRWQSRYQPVLGSLMREHEVALRRIRDTLVNG